MNKKYFSAILLMAFSINAHAAVDDMFQSGDLWYSITSESQPSVKVIAEYVAVPNAPNYISLDPELVIPQSVNHGGKEYAVTAIDGAFDGCTSLKSVTIPASVTSISSFSFFDCLRVNSLTLLDGPDSLELGNTNVIGDMENLTDIYLGRNLTCKSGSITFEYSEYYSSNSFRQLKSIKFGKYVNEQGAPQLWNLPNLSCLVLGEGFTSLPSYFTQGLTALKELSLPGSIKTIDEGAFNKLAPVSIRLEDSDSELTFHHRQYWDLTNLTDIYLGRNVNFIPDVRNGKVSNLTVGDCVTELGNFSYIPIKKLVLGKNVKSIKEGAFNSCENLKELVMNEQLTSIGGGAFFNTSIVDVELPKSLTFLGRGAFDYDKLKSFVIDGTDLVIELISSQELFKGKTLTIPACVKSFGGELPGVVKLVIEDTESVLENVPVCANATSLYLGRPVAEMDPYGWSINFRGCYFKDVTIGGKVKNVNPKLFLQHKQMETLTLQEGVETIGEDAFMETESLKRINFPSTLKSLARNSFWFTGKKMTIYCPAVVPPAGMGEAMDIVNMTGSTVFVPIDSVGAYKSSEWQYFNIVGFDFAGIADVMIDTDTSDDYYTVDGRKVTGEITPGLYIIHKRGVPSRTVIVR